MTRAEKIQLAKDNVVVYAQRIALGTASIEELIAAVRWYNEVRGMAPPQGESVQ